MPIPSYDPPIPAIVPKVVLVLVDRLAEGEHEASQDVTYEFTLKDVDGRTILHQHRTGDAEPYLVEAGGGLAQMAQDLIEAARGLVETAVIP